MKSFARALIVAVATTSLASAANAAISVNVTPGTDPYSGPAPTYDFESAATTPTFSGGAVVGPGTTAGLFAQPFGSTGLYYSVGPSTSSPGVITLSALGGGINGLSLIWGSVDSYNTLEFLDSMGGVLATFTGNDIFNPANGDQTNPNTNPLVSFTLTGADADAFSALRLTSTQNAFEIDNIAAVPEPGTWAMMLLGFGAIGFAMRRRKTALPQLA